MSKSNNHLLVLLLIFAGASAATDTLTQSESLSVGQTLTSPGQIFELGFFSLGNPGRRYVGIWYRNITAQKPIWVANRETPISTGDTNSSLMIGSDGNLRVLDGKSNTVWSTDVAPQKNSTIAMLCSRGNLVLRDNVSGSTLWDSFSHPGDTFLAGMSLGSNKRTGETISLSSWKTDDDPSPGDFVNWISDETPPQTIVSRTSNSKRFWRSGPWDGWRFVGLYNTEVGYSNGLTMTQDNQQGTVFLTYNAVSKSYSTLITLSPEGSLKMAHWYIDETKGGVTWVSLHIPCEVYGACGPFGVCDRNRSRTCQCLEGFVPKAVEEWSKGNWTGGCVRRTELLCKKNTSTFATGDAKPDGFLRLNAVKLPDHHLYKFDLDALGCRAWCLSNCSCPAYAYVDGIGCLVWNGDLFDVQKFSSHGARLFLRVAHSDLGGNDKLTQKIILGTAIPGAIFLFVFMYGLYKWIANRRGGRVGNISKRRMMESKSQSESPDLRMFDFKTLAIATGNFSETNKLGAGGFGSVYRGKLEDGHDIAVKRLSVHSGQGAIEFKNEILLVSRLRHRNLVQLLGYCFEGDEKLLIYEHLKNKSLDTFLFDARNRVQLDWAKRFNIIEGIARGLLYLHRDSCLRIIHRDLKASNILLDDKMNAKISDFGIARAFQITEQLTNTRRIIGTSGYMSPEYAVGGFFSEKSDVFSFGVLLLEIISGEKISHHHENSRDLLGHAWKLWNEGMGLSLMDEELSTSCSGAEFIKCLQIGLLCAQDHAADRPTMPAVVLMLTGDTDIPQPARPTFYDGLLYSDHRQHPTTVSSQNDLSLTIEAR